MCAPEEASEVSEGAQGLAAAWRVAEIAPAGIWCWWAALAVALSMPGIQ